MIWLGRSPCGVKTGRTSTEKYINDKQEGIYCHE